MNFTNLECTNTCHAKLGSWPSFVMQRPHLYVYGSYKFPVDIFLQKATPLRLFFHLVQHLPLLSNLAVKDLGVHRDRPRGPYHRWILFVRVKTLHANKKWAVVKKESTCWPWRSCVGRSSRPEKSTRDYEGGGYLQLLLVVVLHDFHRM